MGLIGSENIKEIGSDAAKEQSKDGQKDCSSDGGEDWFFRTVSRLYKASNRVDE